MLNRGKLMCKYLEAPQILTLQLIVLVSKSTSILFGVLNVPQTKPTKKVTKHCTFHSPPNECCS